MYVGDVTSARKGLSTHAQCRGRTYSDGELRITRLKGAVTQTTARRGRVSVNSVSRGTPSRGNRPPWFIGTGLNRPSRAAFALHHPARRPSYAAKVHRLHRTLRALEQSIAHGKQCLNARAIRDDAQKP